MGLINFGTGNNTVYLSGGTEGLPQTMNPGYPPQAIYSAPYPTEPPPTYSSLS